MKLYQPSRVSRSLGERFFFKAYRDSTQKSAMVRRAYPPGMHTKRRRRGPSDFGLALREKQKIKYLYGLSDTALKGYVRRARRSRAATRSQKLLEALEGRLDSVVFRLGLAPSRRIARQLASHGHILVNGRSVRIPSRRVHPGERVSVRELAQRGGAFTDAAARLKKYEPPPWLELDREAWAGTLVRMPTLNDRPFPYSLDKIIEFYSR